MSDDWIEDGIRDNAGHLALAGALMAHSQRRQQLQSLEASRKHQAQIAKTEAERLEVEKKRLELEQLKQQADKEEKEAVRQLRVLMAEVGGDFEFLSSRGDFKGSPQGNRRDYAMAVLLSKLALVRSRSDSLSDLNDLKELISLENSAQELAAKHFVGRDSFEIARSKWREIEAWIQSVENLKQAVQQECSIVPQESALQMPSQNELEQIRRRLEDDLTSTIRRVQAQVDCLPVDAAENGVVLSELSELATMDDLRDGKKDSRCALFAKSWEEVAVTKRSLQPGMTGVNVLQPRLVQQMNSAISALRKWQDQLTDHEQLLQRLAGDLEAGRLSGAAVSGKKLGKVKFAALNYKPLTDLQSLEYTLKKLEGAKRWQAAQLIKELRATYPKAEVQSELIQHVNKHQARYGIEQRQAVTLALVLLGLISFGYKVIVDGQHKAEVKLRAFQREVKDRLSMEVHSGAAGGRLDVPLSASFSAQFCFIPAGSFTMGSPIGEEGRSSDESQVEVSFSQPFWLAKTEVTQAQWQAVMGSKPSQFKGEQLPVEYVSWENAQAFIAKLNDTKLLPEGWKFMLPTEAEWEYACRAGEKGPYSGGSVNEVGWYGDNSEEKTQEVGQKKPNAWGLQDMHGNVSEWCADWYAEKLQSGADLLGPKSGDYRVCRGGSWYFSASSCCRAASRERNFSSVRNSYLGFRLALVPSK